MKKLYYVDEFSDPSFPSVCRWSEGSDRTPMTLAKAKRELIASIRSKIDHWRGVIVEVKSYVEEG